MTLAAAPPASVTRRAPSRAGEWALGLANAAFLLLFVAWPAATVVYVAFTEKGTNSLTLVNFADFFANDLFLRSLWNSIWVGAMTVVWASAIALPLAVLTTRFDFRGAIIIQTQIGRAHV